MFKTHTINELAINQITFLELEIPQPTKAITI